MQQNETFVHFECTPLNGDYEKVKEPLLSSESFGYSWHSSYKNRKTNLWMHNMWNLVCVGGGGATTAEDLIGFHGCQPKTGIWSYSGSPKAKKTSVFPNLAVQLVQYELYWLQVISLKCIQINLENYQCLKKNVKVSAVTNVNLC